MWEPMQYLTIDPGATVGWAAFRPNSCHYSCGQIPHDKVWTMLEQARWTYELEGPIVVEKFLYRQGLPKIDFRPVEVIGVIKEWARQTHWEIVWQTPAEGKGFFKDEHLKNANLYRAGMPHAMDAVRHLLYFRKAFHMLKKDSAPEGTLSS